MSIKTPQATVQKSAEAVIPSLPIPVVAEADGVVTLHFQSEYVQSQMVLEDPDFLALSYTRTMMAFECIRPNPRHIALIGLGGGSIAKWCYRHHPDAILTVVEINPHVISLRDRFHIPADDHRFQIVCEDGAKFITRYSNELDILLVDAFDADSLPEDLCSLRFYQDCYASLAAQGLLIVNLCAADQEKAISRIHGIFHGKSLSSTDKDGNTIVYACKGEVPWLENASTDFLKRKCSQFEKVHGLGKAMPPTD